MKHTTNFPSPRRGFTLVELLVVITIIAVLAGLGFAGFNLGIQAAKKTSATTCMSQLITASDDFFEEYSQLPLGSTSNSDEEKNTDNELMSVLVGIDEEENRLERSFFDFQKSKGKGPGAFNGLERTENRAELLGPWLNSQKTDRYYRVLYDYDYNEELREPQNLGSEIIYNRRTIVYHMGKDGKIGGEHDEDNVYSWNKSD